MNRRRQDNEQTDRPLPENNSIKKYISDEDIDEAIAKLTLGKAA